MEDQLIGPVLPVAPAPAPAPAPATMACSFCGKQKPIPAVPGREQPDEFCWNCGKGEPLAEA